MSASDLAIVAALLFGYGMLSARLERFDVTAPIVFVLAGVLLTHGPLTPLGITPSNETVKVLAEATLVLVLFSDASRVGLRDLRADAGLCLRLLGIGLPLTIGLGALLALALFPGLTGWLALVIGAALAPTDAALGAGMMVNPAVPARIRRLINVESGLNDGIATPFVLIALAGAGTAAQEHTVGPAEAVAELLLGVLVGLVVGGVGGYLVRVARRREWAAEGFAGPAVLALAACAYASSLALHGNGFIAAFVGGLAYRALSGRRGERLVPFVEETGGLVSLLVWLAFGAIAVVPALRALSWATAGYAVLSLTVIRMVPVALALAGGRLGRQGGRVHRLVRPPRPGLGGVRPARARRPGPGYGRPPGRGHRLHGAAQRAAARAYRRATGPPVRAAAGPGGRSRDRRAGPAAAARAAARPAPPGQLSGPAVRRLRPGSVPAAPHGAG